MSLDFNSPEFEVIRDEKKCIQCQVCVRQCSNKVHLYDEEDNVVRTDDIKCVNCHRCAVLCPTKALVIKNILLSSGKTQTGQKLH